MFQNCTFQVSLLKFLILDRGFAVRASPSVSRVSCLIFRVSRPALPVSSWLGGCEMFGCCVLCFVLCIVLCIVRVWFRGEDGGWGCLLYGVYECGVEGGWLVGLVRLGLVRFGLFGYAWVCLGLLEFYSETTAGFMWLLLLVLLLVDMWNVEFGFWS